MSHARKRRKSSISRHGSGRPLKITFANTIYPISPAESEFVFEDFIFDEAFVGEFGESREEKLLMQMKAVLNKS